MQPEPGHVLPTLAISAALQSQSYHVVYLTSGTLAEHLREQGFDAETFAPEEAQAQQPLSGYASGRSGRSFWQQFGHGAQRAAFITARVREAIEEHEASLLLVDHLFFRNHGLFAEEQFCGAHVVHLATSLPRWDEPAEHSAVRRWVLCPAAFELECFLRRYTGVSFGEPCVDWGRKEVAANRTKLRHGAKLILCAPGTQMTMHVNAESRLRAVIQAARLMPDCDFMVAAGAERGLGEAPADLPPNVTLAAHIPQLAMLRDASALITHGGLGSLKEAISCGVPTLVMPVVFDQPYNAMRVRELSLGVALYPEKVVAESIVACLGTLLDDGSIHAAVNQMRTMFQEQAEQKPITTMLLTRLGELCS